MELRGILFSLAALVLCGQGSAGPAVAPTDAGVCWVMGDPHYHTFDGNYFNFMGNCSYILAKNCISDNAHPVFDVSVKNERDAKSLLTAVSQVTINIYGQVIQMVKNEISMVRVNYEAWNLPVTLQTSEGELKLVQSGLSVIFSTDFGLNVQYDWEHYVKVTVPGSFMGRVCGMCGDFDGNKDNDLVKEDGSEAENVEAFGKSWMVPDQKGAQYCLDECTGNCQGCSFLQGIGANLFCGTMSPVLDDQFADCHSYMDPSVFTDMCQFDQCRGGDMTNYICNMLSVYTDVCQRAGINVPDWRSAAKCSNPTCPENSHFEYCGNACPATCENPSAPSSCKSPCVQTCTCDDGYVRSGDQCIPKDQCGCQYNGRFVELGQTIWGDEMCTTQLFCSGGGELATETANCPSGQACNVVNGLRDCYPVHYGTCLVSGDPHYLTFDGLAYDFQGTCGYELAGVCSKDTAMEQFDVTVQNDGRNKQTGSSTKQVEVKVYGNSIVINKDLPGVVLVNGEKSNLPVNLNSSAVQVYQSGFFAVVETDFKLSVSYDWNSVVMVTVPSTYMGAMCGLCGNFNSNSSDDMLLPNGQVAQSALEMGESWVVEELPGCLNGCTGPCPACNITQKLKYETNPYCGLMNDPSGPFRDCMSVVDATTFYQGCIYDLCYNQGAANMQCKTLTAYTAACQAKGVTVYPWRTSSLCNIQCPSNSHYAICDNGCGSTCLSQSTSAVCKAQCQEGCVCNSGLYLSGTQCVPAEQCGCQYEGKYYQSGQVFYPDGLCAEKCVCNGTKAICTKFSCGPLETCNVTNGVRSCLPVGKATCTISGDPHYNTFDNVTYNFMGTCTYTVSEGCHLEGTHLTPFNVAVENEKWMDMSVNPQVSVARLVAVTVYDTVVILRRNQIGLVMVNGTMMNLPVNINNGQIVIQQTGAKDVISTDFGLKVTYDLVYHVTITVPSNYYNKTCGLCGDYNGNKNDEFTLPDGGVTKDATTFGAAWKIGVPDVVCDDGCVGDSCPTCPEDIEAVIEKDCSIITDPKGPFAACQDTLDPEPYYRDCIYDVCVAGAQGSKMLCDSINAYVIDCQDIGINVSNWRSSRFCPMSCPANSHYENCALPCETPCPGLTSINCADTCAEGCACDTGFKFNGTGCVPQEECSCYINGQTIKVGETVMTANCQEKYICQKSGVVLTEHMSCDLDQYCGVQGGVRGCYLKQCTMSGSGAFSTFNDQEGQVTSGGMYDMVKVCNDNQTENFFRVVMDLQSCGTNGSIVAVGIFAFFDGAFVIVNSNFDTMVNGRTVSLPYGPDNGLTIQMINGQLVIDKSSTLVLTYSDTHQLTVTVGDDVAPYVCGACGTLTVQTQAKTTFTTSSIQNYLNGYKSSVFNFCDQ